MSRDLRLCHPKLESAFASIKAAYETMFPERQLLVTCTYRSVEEQAALYAQGRTKPGPRVTNCDGVIKRSKHNDLPANAIDVAVLVRGANAPADAKMIVSWDIALYKPLVDICREFGVVSGGTWSAKNRDWPHIELPGEL